MSAPTWRAVHAYVHTGAAATDALLTRVVAPTVRTLRANGLVDGWFFIRYWQGGPHLRIRLSGTDPTALEKACLELRHALESALSGPPPPPLDRATFYAAFELDDAAMAEMGWNEHGAVTEEPYEQEVKRYGGSEEAMAVAEQMFEVSSEIALAVLAGSPSEQAKTGAALDLLLGFCPALFGDTADSVKWLREYAVMWRYLDSAVAHGSAGIRAAAESAFVTDHDRLVSRRGMLREDTAPAAARHWAGVTQQVTGWLRQNEDQLTSSPDVVMVSQLHMLANRMGLTASDEVYLVWLASFVLAAPGERRDHFADGADAPDRALHEASKFRPTTFAEQRPLPGPPLHRQLDFAMGDPVPLPVPEQAALASPLSDVLSARRSHRDGLSGPLGLADLGAVLAYGAGFIGTEDVEVDGVPTQRAVRAFPSAGMSCPTVVRVLSFDVEGLRPGVFEYLPDTHALHQVAQLPSREALRESSPFFTGDPPRIDVGEVPAVLFLAADISSMRRRYGLRTQRFATLETGHVAQNMLLVATALGLRSVPVGGFFDDAASELAQLDGYDEVLGYLMPLGAAPAHHPPTDDARTS